MKDPVAMDEPVDRYDSELTDSDLGGSHEVESVSDEAQFLTLLDLPAFQDFKPTRLGTFPEHEALRAKWDGGVSPRFRAHYDAWLQSKQMNTKFLHAGVLTHSKNNSEVGKGFAASVWLGITVADGREVALKVFMPSSANDTEEKQAIENHFNKEMMALKRHGGTPGTVGYLGSFQRAIENEDEGVMEYQNVVILELMEGTLQEAVSNWSRDLIGSFEHLLLVRYVLGSILDILGQLNHGQFQSLVHRDVKPDNIMVDRFKNIRIIDFGISRVVDKYRQCTKVTSSDGTVIYTSPEAQRQFPEAHITSDLYSVGMVAQFLLTGRDPSTFADPRILPLAWPEYHRLAMQHLHRELVKQDPNERALNSIARDTNTPHHRILLSHPFFWTARKSVSFLVALGNFTTPPLPGLSDAVRSCYGKEGWFAGVEEFESSAFPVREGDKESPWSLLRFIRHQYTHATDQGLNGAADNPLLTRPVILEHFPRLVLECWKHLIGYSRFISRKCPTLAIYFRSGWDVQAARDPEEERSWL
jgi:serine/threonine protein kinase